MKDRTAVIIPAAGAGQRMGGIAKPFMMLSGEPLLLHTLRPFLADSRVTRIVVALDASTAASPPSWLCVLDSRITIVPGGMTRGDSVMSALSAVDDADIVLIHDAARPLISPPVIDRAIRAAGQGECVVAAIPVTDTIQQVDGDRRIVATPDRAPLWQAQTPQAFPRAIAVEAYRKAAADGFSATDDAAVIARYGGTVRVIEGARDNIKVTVPGDVLVAEALLASR